MSAHDTLASRLSDILTRLNRGERLSVSQLAADYNVCTRTIRRDLKDRLTSLHWKENGPEYYSIDLTELGQYTEQEVRRMLEFFDVLKLLPDTRMMPLASEKSQTVKIHGAAQEDFRHQFNDFERVRLAIEQHRIICFSYQKRGATTTEKYTVHPYRLLNQNGIWYILALHQGAIKSFCLTRTSLLRALEETYTPDNEIAQRIAAAKSIYFQEQIPEVRLHVSATAARYFLRRELLPNQEILEQHPDGSLTLISRHGHHREILPTVQYWIPHLRIESPQELQEELTQMLTDYLQQNTTKE